VLVRDLDRAEAFYTGVIGLPVQRRWTDDAGAPRSVWLDLGGGAFLAIERASSAAQSAEPAEPSSPSRPPGTGWHCVALSISRDERDAFRARLAAAGSKVERESPFTLYFRDPEGNLVALSHFPDPA
jgi:catechol 2,3-dioxygenase-like lactoylglutathione lyase family enzyme